MRFSFTEDQRALRAAVRDLLDRTCTPADVRAAWTTEARSPLRWRELAAMGVVGLLAPEDAGGSGGDEIDMVGVLEETGRAALPEPVVETAAVAVPLLRDAGPRELLADVASGKANVSIAVGSPYVADAHTADTLILWSGDELHAVPGSAAAIHPQPSVDGARRLSTVDWEPSPQTLIASGTAGRQLADAAFDRGALGAAAQLLGVAGRTIEMAGEYALTREQFGRPIGSFQAVKHMLADALVELEFARPVVYRAAHSVARDDEHRARDVSMAKAFASRAALTACRTALQVHGAVGYTAEHDLHLWLARGWALSAAWGDAAWHRTRVGHALQDEAGRI